MSLPLAGLSPFAALTDKERFRIALVYASISPAWPDALLDAVLDSLPLPHESGLVSPQPSPPWVVFRLPIGGIYTHVSKETM